MSSARPPVLVIVDPSIGRTGAFTCAQNMALALQGHRPALLVVPREARFSAVDLAPFAGVERLALRASSRSCPAALAWLVALIPSGWRLRRLLRETRATHLVLNDFYLLQGVICRLLGFRGRIITWVRVEPKRAGGRLTGLLWALIGLSSDRVIAVSGSVERQIPAWLKPTVLYDCLASLPDRPASPPVYGRLVYLGHLMRGKGQDAAIEAFAAIAADVPDAVLEFHGGTLGLPGNEEWKEALQQRCRDLGLASRITFHGPYTNPFTALSGAYAALNFSVSETFSFTVLEAMSAGVTVIATDSGGPAEIIQHGATGVLVPVGACAAMSEAMAALLANPAQTAAMGVAAARSVSERFTAAAYRQQLLALLRV
jgi:glycosyltransferase involved in cell wall biosynthesis